MILKFRPQRRNEDLILSKNGDVLAVNGVQFDFSPLPEGATLPASAIDSVFFCGPVERIDGEIHFTLLLPHGPNPPHEVAFPEPLNVEVDGPITLPGGAE